jgi:hypothetical protein
MSVTPTSSLHPARLRTAFAAIALLASPGCVGEVGASAPHAGIAGGGGSPASQADASTAGDQAAVPPGTSCAPCAGYVAPVALAPLPPVLNELSGLAASRRHPGVLYAHNDSANSTVLFALDDAARLLAEVRLVGADSNDFEAIAVGPCPPSTPTDGAPVPESCIYLGDIGDNDRLRGEYSVYVIPEPDALGSVPALDVSFQRFTFAYPDGAQNAETLLVEPRMGRVFVITKGASAVAYELLTPFPAAGRVTVTGLGALALPSADPVTDGSFHPCGDRVLVRTEKALYELTRPGDAALEAVFSAAPAALPLPVEAKGEAVSYARDGARYFSSGEAVSGASPPALSMVACAGGGAS